MSTQTELAVGTTSEEMQIFDGVMLGDGCLDRYTSSSRLLVNLSKTSKDGRLTAEDNIAWLRFIKNECLIPLGVEVSGMYPKLYSSQSREKPYQAARLSSRSSSLLAEQHDRWYASTGEWARGGYRRGDTKVVPRDFTLSPATLAHWFIGDGGSTLYRTSPSFVRVTLATCCFTGEEVYRLITMLNDMGVATVKPHRLPTKKGSGLVIIIAQASVDDFFDIIAPHMPSHLGLLQYKRNNGHSE